MSKRFVFRTFVWGLVAALFCLAYGMADSPRLPEDSASSKPVTDKPLTNASRVTAPVDAIKLFPADASLLDRLKWNVSGKEAVVEGKVSAVTMGSAFLPGGIETYMLDVWVDGFGVAISCPLDDPSYCHYLAGIGKVAMEVTYYPQGGWKVQSVVPAS